MLVAPDSRAILEAFFRSHLRDEALSLPPLRVHSGWFAQLLTRVFHIEAITLSRWIFITPRLVARDGRGRLRAPARLIVHEAMHVLQYECEGRVRFLFLYVGEYARALFGADGRGAQTHAAAYRTISFEKRAREAEDAYDTWRTARERAI
ncbi:MAG: DUF4157 domain-containing protein [Pyrinomonadaceae bacterium]